MTIKHKIIVFGFFVLLASMHFRTAAAASSVAANGLSVTPAIINLSLQKDQAQTSFTVDIKNNSKTQLTIATSSLDFKSLNDTGGVAFISNNSSQLTNKHSLAAWIDTPALPVVIDSGQTKTITINVENRSDLGPGGHYAAILYTVANLAGNAGSTKVNVNEVASTLVFISKTDGAVYDVRLKPPVVKTSWFNLPSNIDLFFTNSGNIQTPPRGLVTILSPASKEVSRGQINTDSSIVLPEGTRLYRTSMFNTGKAWLPGIYKIHVQYRAEGSNKIRYQDSSFLYLNLISLGEIFIAIVLLLFISRYLIRKSIKLKRRFSHKNT